MYILGPIMTGPEVPVYGEYTHVKQSSPLSEASVLVHGGTLSVHLHTPPAACCTYSTYVYIIV